MPAPYPVRLSSPRNACAPVDLPGVAQGDGGNGVLLLPPLGEERKGVAAPLRELSERLANRGQTVLRFDYFGTGEAPGAFTDATWEGWRADVAAAARWLAQRTSSPAISVVAVRGSGWLAAEWDASPEAELKRLVWWEPTPDLKAWRREAARRSHFRLGSASSPDALDIDGYVFSEAMAAALDERAGPPPKPAGAVYLLGVAQHGRLSSGVKTLAAAWNVEPTLAPVAPFWLESGAVDAGPLLRVTEEALPIPL